MRLPFLQLESDLIAHGAAEVAQLAGCHVTQALGHIALLRAWAVSHAGDDAPPDGWVPGDAAGRRIEAAAQWGGERGALLQALLDAGQVQEEPGGMRVLHLEPYVVAWNKNAKAKERMRTARERSANMRESNNERSAKFGGQTQTQTQTQKETTASQAPDAPGPGDDLPDASEHAEEVPERPALELVSPATGRKPRQPSKAEALYADLQASRRERCEQVGAPFVDDGWKPARMNRDLGALARLEEDSPEADTLNAAWAEYLADESRAGMDVPWSLGYFLASRSTWEGRALKAARS